MLLKIKILAFTECSGLELWGNILKPCESERSNILYKYAKVKTRSFLYSILDNILPDVGVENAKPIWLFYTKYFK